jgi:aldehyde dehydrogenase (NAD+)
VRPRVTLELGGKSPVVVAADADVEVAARRIAWVKVMNSGQTCIAPDYVLVHESVADALVRRVGESFDAMRSDGVGLRIVNERQYERLCGYLAATDGTIAKGGGTDPDGWTIEPTIVVDPSPAEPLMTEEIFGPILPMLTFGELDEVVSFVNGRPKPLALYVFSNSRRVQRQLVDAIPSGGAVMNHIAMHCLVPSLPFGGVGASGMGAYHGRWGFETFSHRRAVLAKRARPDLRLVYPPYTA